MLLIDPREGSKELIEPLKRLGLDVEACHLDFGDVAFVGRGEQGAPLNIGIEYKKLPDLVSSIKTERLQGLQLPGMRAAHPGTDPLYDLAWLLVQGELVYDARGTLMRHAGRRSFKPMAGHLTVDQLFKRLTVMHVRGGLNPMWVKDRRDAVRWIAALYRTFTDRDLDKHKSHLGIYRAPTLVPLTQTEDTLRTLPGVGPAVARAAAKRFGTIYGAIVASIEDWAELTTKDDKGKTRKFGESNARKVKEAIRG